MIQDKKFEISIDELWDYKGTDGTNIVKGRIISIKAKKCVVFKSNHLVEIEGVSSDILVLTIRYYGDDFSDLSKLNIVNGHLLNISYNDNMTADDLLANYTKGFIGGLEPAMD